MGVNPNLPYRLKRRPFLRRLWRSYSGFRQLGYSHWHALRWAWTVST